MVVGLGQAELREHLAHVLLDGALADLRAARRSRRWSGPRPSARAPRARAGQRVERPTARRPISCATTSGSITVPPAATRARGGDELLHVGDAVLEQVADAARAAREQLGRVALLDVLAEDQDRGVRAGGGAPRPRRARPRRSASAASGRRRSRGPASCSSSAASSASPSPTAGDDLVAVVGEQRGDAVAQQHEVLGDHDAHGSLATIVVGPPVGAVDVERAVERLDALRRGPRGPSRGRGARRRARRRRSRARGRRPSRWSVDVGAASRRSGCRRS